MIDTHMHADARSYYPYKIPDEMILRNHLNRILELDTARAKEHGLDLKVALGIHPTNSNINPDKIFEELHQWIESKQIVAIGEIGLEDLTDSEIEIFKRQLDIADETNSKVIIHTPRKNKKEVLNMILDILPQHLSENQAIIDHINPAVVGDVIDSDCMLGLTVQPQKMDKFEAVSILDEYGFDRFVLNSDISNKASDPLSVPKTVRELVKQGYPNDEIQKVASLNAEEFFDL